MHTCIYTYVYTSVYVHIDIFSESERERTEIENSKDFGTSIIRA